MKADRESGGERPHLIYVESGSYLGLSAHIVTATALGEGVPVLAYAHDLFDTSTTDLWDHASADKTNLQHFYSNVRRNGFEHNIIPVIGGYKLQRQCNMHNKHTLLYPS